jgi:hypothetical protein
MEAEMAIRRVRRIQAKTTTLSIQRRLSMIRGARSDVMEDPCPVFHCLKQIS